MILKPYYLIPIACCFSLNAAAQYIHAVQLSANLYANFFNPEKDPFGPVTLFDAHEYVPELSYSLSKGKQGLEVYYNYYFRKYHNIEYSELANGGIAHISRALIGINYHYKAYQSKCWEISPFAGINYGWYNSDAVSSWVNNGFFYEPVMDEASKDMATAGLQLGINLKAFVWKGLYIGSNLRYTTAPWAESRYYRQSLVWNAGIGYRF